MRNNTFLASALSALFVLGCGGGEVVPETARGPDGLSNTARRPNGTGIHVGSTQPESWFGLAGTSLTWFMDGFSRRADGSYWARGWYSLDLLVLPAEAQVLRAELGDVRYSVVAMRTSGGRLSIELRDSSGASQTVQDQGLLGLTLVLRVPDALGLTLSTYRLRFTAADSVDSQFGDVFGYQLEFRQAGLLAGGWAPYCKGPKGEAQRSVFYQGAHWHPMDGSRSDGADLLSMTCESGSVAKCMRWGYRPWASAESQGGVATNLADYHQACLHMKRASYCGDSQANTIDGTGIYIQDQLSPSINSGSLSNIEAVWSPQGAVCLSNRRHPELLFLGCAQPLPTCTAAHQGAYLLATGTVASGGGLLGLTD